MSTATVPPPSRGDSRLRIRAGRAPLMFGTDLGSAPLPGRGLFLSILLHCLFALATLVVPWSYWIPPDVHLVTMQEQARAQQALLLPDLQPMGSEGRPAPAPSPARVERKSANRGGEAGAAATMKAVHEGPQIIVSNPPHPDNSQQTILQPELPPARLPRPLAIPPMVSIAHAEPVLQAPPRPEPPQQAAPPAVAVLPLSVSQQLSKVEAPKLPLPESNPTEKLSGVAGAPVPSALPKLARQAVPLADQSGEAPHSIIVIDASPVANAFPAELPPGELHGAFTVAPTGVIHASGTGAAGGGITATGEPGVGNGTGTTSGPSVGQGSAAGTGTATGTAATAGAGAGTGMAPGIGGAGAANATGIGTGAGVAGGTGISIVTGNGSGNGSGRGSGHGAGTGTGTGSSPFAGITIQGGSGGNTGYRNNVPPTHRAQTSYDVTIVASGASGGGFKDYGVFQEGASYTVYLDMTDVGLRSDWPLQYAPQNNANRPDPPVRGVLEPPYATTKPLPRLPSQAVQRSHGGTVVVYGVINQNGRWEHLRVMQSPDPAFNAIVLEALSKWSFRPAQAGGAPVAVKCLLGLPVYSLTGD